MGVDARAAGSLLIWGGQEQACPRCGFRTSCDDPVRGAPLAALWGETWGTAAHASGAWPGLGVRESPVNAGSLAALLAGRPSLAIGTPLRVPVVPPAQQGLAGDGGAAARQAERVGTLARFIDYLGANGIMDGLGAPRGHHRLHKYAYIAKGLGTRMDYDFDFLETGAFSVKLAADAFRLDEAAGGAEPFAGDAQASAAFLELVRGKEKKWLQLATFAVRERGREGALEDFMAVPQGIIKYDAMTTRSAFEEVGKIMGMAAEAVP